MRRFLMLAVAGWSFWATDPKAMAGLYHHDLEVMAAFDLDEKGYANPGGLDAFLPLLRMAQESNVPTTEKARNLRESIARRMKKGVDHLKPEEKLALGAELLRLRSDDKAISEAINLLQPLTQHPPKGFEFLILAHQAQAQFQRGDFRQAHELEYSALKDYPFPTKIDGLTAEQVKWYERLERDYYLPFLRHRKEDADLKKASLLYGIDPLFPTSQKGKAATVDFVGESGKYSAGSIAQAEMEKLPPDAIAIVQQMILWNPGDSRLIWQLAELYNAAGDLKAAARLFDMCVNEMKYSNPELMKHRAIVVAARDEQLEIEEDLRETKKRKEEETKRLAEKEKRQRSLMVAAGLVVVIVFLGYWQTREFRRRYFNRRESSANQVH